MMPKNTGNDNWGTPEKIYNKLNSIYHFNFDPCPLNYNYEIDGLTLNWGTKTFVNPPYSNIKPWVKKAYYESLKGKLIVMLLKCDPSTNYFHDYILNKADIKFIRGRLRYYKPFSKPNSAPFPSFIVIYNNDYPSIQLEEF